MLYYTITPERIFRICARMFTHVGIYYYYYCSCYIITCIGNTTVECYSTCILNPSLHIACVAPNGIVRIIKRARTLEKLYFLDIRLSCLKVHYSWASLLNCNSRGIRVIGYHRATDLMRRMCACVCVCRYTTETEYYYCCYYEQRRTFDIILIIISLRIRQMCYYKHV